MTTIISCPSCKARLSITPQMAGTSVICPTCRQQLLLSGQPQPATATPISLTRPARALQPLTNPAHGAAAARGPNRTTILFGAVASLVVLLIVGLLAGALVWTSNATHKSDIAQVQRPSVPPPPPLPTPPSPPAPPASIPDVPSVEKKSDSPPIPEPAPLPQTPLPAPAPTQSPEAAPALNLLAGLPDSCRLPAIDSSAVEKLFSFADAPDETLNISLRSTAADIPAKGAFVAEPNDEARSWRVCYVSGFDADLDGNIDKVTLATMHCAGRDMTFAWNVPLADPKLRQQAANCQIEVHHDQSVHMVQLREPQVLSPIVLDLGKDKETVEFDAADHPKADTLRVEIRELTDFTRGAKLRGGANLVALGKQALIEFDQFPGAQIEIRFFRTSPSAKLTLRLEPVFQEKNVREFELTLDRLENLKQGAEQALAEARAGLAAAESVLENWETEFNYLQANPPTTRQEQLLWTGRMKKAREMLDQFQKRVAGLRKQIAQHAARLAAVPQMRAFLNELHQRATIRYVVYAECGERDIMLVDGCGTGWMNQVRARGTSSSQFWSLENPNHPFPKFSRISTNMLNSAPLDAIER